MTQIKLFVTAPEPSPPYQRHSRTSVEAATLIRPAVETARGRVLDALTAAGPAGLTDLEMQRRLMMDANTQRPRRVELVKAGLVVDSGKTRPTGNGRKATVWVAV